jgi:transposase
VPPTNREHDARVRATIAAYHAAKGYGPSYREVADSLDLSLSWTAAIIARGLEEGWLTHTPRTPRTLRVAHEEEHV